MKRLYEQDMRALGVLWSVQDDLLNSNGLRCSFKEHEAFGSLCIAYQQMLSKFSEYAGTDPSAAGRLAAKKEAYANLIHCAALMISLAERVGS